MQFEKSKETMNDWLIALFTLLGLSNILQRRWVCFDCSEGKGWQPWTL